MNISKIVEKQKDYFHSGVTLDHKFRINALKSLREAILNNEEELYKALKKDLNKGRLESYLTEIHMVISEINLAIRNLKKWMKPKKVSAGLLNFPSKAFIKPDPYGVALIISPWNYPFQLLFSPLVGAIAAGNTAILKPSEYSYNTSEVSQKIIDDAFDKEYITLIQGEVDVTTKLLEERTDFIFFTGSTGVGKIVAKAAAEYLTPYTLELGGKSPSIIDSSCDLDLTAKRVVWGKLINGGQTCVAPDYVYIEESVKDKFIELFIKYAREFYGDNPVLADHYCKIINKRHFDRLSNLLIGEKIVYGGDSHNEELKIHPTIVDSPKDDSPIMKDEIFGPILPIKTFREIEEVPEFIKSMGKPLALYIFSKNRKNIDYILHNTSSGGVCINDTVSHLISHELPFGGVQESGFGAYHGKESFTCFSHNKSILHKGNWDPSVKFHPYKDEHKWINLFKKLN